jgi:hypothetical protein
MHTVVASIRLRRAGDSRPYPDGSAVNHDAGVAVEQPAGPGRWDPLGAVSGGSRLDRGLVSGAEDGAVAAHVFTSGSADADAGSAAIPASITDIHQRASITETPHRASQLRVSSTVGSRRFCVAPWPAGDTTLAARAASVPCRACGFTAGLLPADGLVVAVMAIPSQYRELLTRFGPLDEIDGVLRDRHDATAWSALERIAHVADSLHASAKCAVALLEGDRGHFAVVHVDAPRAGSNAVPSRVVLASLHAAVTDLARAVSRAEVDVWARRAQLGEHSVSVRELLDTRCTKPTITSPMSKRFSTLLRVSVRRLARMQDDSGVEIATIGNEGFVGLMVALGGSAMNPREYAVVQVPGKVLASSSSDVGV